MEKNQYELCIKVLQRLHNAGVLDSLVLIGSWCIPFYKEYFSKSDFCSNKKYFSVAHKKIFLSLGAAWSQKKIDTYIVFGFWHFTYIQPRKYHL